jgi:flavin-dependent dehydrogenase
MTTLAAVAPGEPVVDVVVAGGGLAGLATATRLARHGWRVVCVEPLAWPRPAVGESLEFSAGKLLADLGISIDSGQEKQHLFPKTSVRVVGSDVDFTVWPPSWFARPPIWCSRVAFHTDRTVLDEQLFCLASDAGVEILHERAASVDHDDDKITTLTTDRGTRLTARWFVDASGHTCRLFGRALGLGQEMLGRPRAAYWARIGQPPDGHATTLFFPEPVADDLIWAWEIPLNDDEVSVGVVMSAARSASLRSSGFRPREIFEHGLGSIPRLRHIVGAHPGVELHATTYTPYRHDRTIGANWLLVGDASAMVDPLTSNGVTSALRHADRAARTVTDALDHNRLSRRHAWAYQHTAPATIATLDRAIEAFVYDPTIRQRLGLRRAVTLYAATGVLTNSLYAKLDPTSFTRSVACAAVLAASRLWTAIASQTLTRLARPVAWGQR